MYLLLRERTRAEGSRWVRIGRLRPGERAAVRVTVRTQRLGRFPNIVAVNSNTRQLTARGKVARARVLVVPRVQPRFTG